MLKLTEFLETILKEQEGGFIFGFPQERQEETLAYCENELNKLANLGNSAEMRDRLREIYPMLYHTATSQKIPQSGLMGRYKAYYRGSSNVDYKNAPGIYRKGEGHDENYYYNEIQVQCPTSFERMGHINKLTFMQHYGCPTRLLDITTNPLVALYFACQGSEKEDGAVHVFCERDKDILYEQSDRVQVLAKLSEFTKEEQDEILFLSYVNLFKGKFPQSTNTKYSDQIIERLYHAIKRDNPAFERELVPLELLTPCFVQVRKDNPRILKQDGAFILSGLNYDEAECAFKIDKKTKRSIAIPGKEKKEILKQLAGVGITKASLFPEADKVAEYLKTGF